MAEQFNENAPWVLFRLKNQILAIFAENTREMITVPEVTPIPRAPEFVRGVINLRGSVIALLDLRVKLNQPSMTAELHAMADELEKRRQDHIHWVDELEKSVEEGTPFTLARDPDDCAFGKWYNSYKPEHTRLLSLLPEMDQPHKAIHASADQAEELLRAAGKRKALEFIKTLRATHMARIMEIFDNVQQAMRELSQEIAIVVDYGGVTLALTVDGVEAVEPLRAGSIENLPGDMGPESNYIITMLGRRIGSGEPVLLPDLSRIVSDYSAPKDGVTV